MQEDRDKLKEELFHFWAIFRGNRKESGLSVYKNKAGSPPQSLPAKYLKEEVVSEKTWTPAW